jgi:hypothetical protein
MTQKNALKHIYSNGILVILVDMTTCSIHIEFFDDSCPQCKKEYRELKGNISETSKGLDTDSIDRSDSIGRSDSMDRSKTNPGMNRNNGYKEFTEERAKKLYGELFIQYLKKSVTEEEAAGKARAIIRKQCRLRSLPFWSWAN